MFGFCFKKVGEVFAVLSQEINRLMEWRPNEGDDDKRSPIYM